MNTCDFILYIAGCALGSFASFYVLVQRRKRMDEIAFKVHRARLEELYRLSQKLEDIIKAACTCITEKEI